MLVFLSSHDSLYAGMYSRLIEQLCSKYLLPKIAWQGHRSVVLVLSTSSTPIALTTVYYWGVPGEFADHGNLVHKDMWSASFLIQALKRQHRCVQ